MSPPKIEARQVLDAIKDGGDKLSELIRGPADKPHSPSQQLARLKEVTYISRNLDKKEDRLSSVAAAKGVASQLLREIRDSAAENKDKAYEDVLAVNHELLELQRRMLPAVELNTVTGRAGVEATNAVQEARHSTGLTRIAGITALIGYGIFRLLPLALRRLGNSVTDAISGTLEYIWSFRLVRWLSRIAGGYFLYRLFAGGSGFGGGGGGSGGISGPGTGEGSGDDPGSGNRGKKDVPGEGGTGNKTNPKKDEKKDPPFKDDESPPPDRLEKKGQLQGTGAAGLPQNGGLIDVAPPPPDRPDREPDPPIRETPLYPPSESKMGGASVVENGVAASTGKVLSAAAIGLGMGGPSQVKEKPYIQPCPVEQMNEQQLENYWHNERRTQEPLRITVLSEKTTPRSVPGNSDKKIESKWYSIDGEDVALTEKELLERLEQRKGTFRYIQMNADKHCAARLVWPEGYQNHTDITDVNGEKHRTWHSDSHDPGRARALCSIISARFLIPVTFDQPPHQYDSETGIPFTTNNRFYYPHQNVVRLKNYDVTEIELPRPDLRKDYRERTKPLGKIFLYNGKECSAKDLLDELGGKRGKKEQLLKIVTRIDNYDRIPGVDYLINEFVKKGWDVAGPNPHTVEYDHRLIRWHEKYNVYNDPFSLDHHIDKSEWTP